MKGAWIYLLQIKILYILSDYIPRRRQITTSIFMVVSSFSLCRGLERQPRGCLTFVFDKRRGCN